jgi:hypothetical protein
MALRATAKQAKLLQMTLDGEAEPAGKASPQNPEEQYQALLFARRNALQGQYPPLGWLFSTLNGVNLPPHVRARVNATGRTKGVLDVWLPVQRGEWAGVAIDLKRHRGGAPSKEQLDWARHLVANGWRVYFCKGALDAWRCLACFLQISGADHIAADLEGQERYVRTITRD